MTVTREDIERVAAVLVRDFRPRKVILFGSRATGTARDDSDIDLLVLFDDDRGCLDAMSRMHLAAHRSVAGAFSLDVLARGESEVARAYRDGDPLLRAALDRGIVLYEAAA